MSSWLNLSSNITSLRDNLSSFTRDVLSESSEDAQEDSEHICHENDNDFVGFPRPPVQSSNDSLEKLQDEINILNLELSSRNEQIENLESENYKVKVDAEKHVSNLKQHLLEKDNELDEYIIKIQELENFKSENHSLKLEIENLKNMNSNNSEQEWNDWNDNDDNNQEISKLELENESLSNELTMKEIVLDSIEKKMKQISKRNVDVADFTTWIDDLMASKKSNDMNSSDQNVLELIKKALYSDNITDLNESNVSMWLDSISKSKVKNSKVIKNFELQLEEIQKQCSFLDNNYDPDQFSSWVTSTWEEKSFYKSENARLSKIISDIENQIRENDEEDEKFVISEFSDWLEQQSSKIDDLSVDIINAQQYQDEVEEKRILEREKLEQLFHEKENEISMLKVELFNEKSKRTDNSPVEVMFAPPNDTQNEDLKENIVELTARCQSLQDELQSTQQIKIDYENLRELYNDLEKEKIDYVIQNKELLSKIEGFETNIQNENDDEESNYEIEIKQLKRQLTVVEQEKEKQSERDIEEITKKLVEITELKTDLNTSQENNSELFSELQTIQSENKALKENINDLQIQLNETKELNEKIKQEMDLLKANEENCLHLLTEKLSQRCNGDQQLAMSFTFAINELISKYDNIAEELAEAAKKIQQQNDVITGKEISDEKLLCEISKLVAEHSPEVLSLEGDIFSALSHIETVMQMFESNITSLKERVEGLESERKEMENKYSLEIQQLKEHTVDKSNVDQSKDDENKELNEMLKRKQEELDEMKGQLSDFTQEISELQEIITKLKSEAAGEESAPKRGRFGEMKRKMQELEDQNKLLITKCQELENNRSSNSENSMPNNAVSNDNSELINKINELTKLVEEKTSESNYFEENCQELDTRCNQLQAENSHITNQFYQMQAYIQQSELGNQYAILQENQAKLHNLSLMLTEKSEECLQLQRQVDSLNSQLIEMRNDTSDMTLIQGECKQLKVMLAERDHQSRFDETLNTLHDENKQLKQLLSTQDGNIQNLQKSLIEKENEVSDMNLVREECKQLKQMLMDQNAPGEEMMQQLQNKCQELEQQIAQKDAKIVEIQNENSDMQLVQEECKQLKKMLMEKSNSQTNESVKPSNVSNNSNLLAASLFNQSTEENSFLSQVKQLEDYIKDAEGEIEIKDQTLHKKDMIIHDLQNSLSNYELLMNECSALKTMLAEKEETFIELQGDLDDANLIVQQRNSELKEIGKMKLEAEDQLNNLTNNFNDKLAEIESLKQELSEKISQEENIHVLQEEYRKVEEKLLASEKTWEYNTNEFKLSYEDTIKNLQEQIQELSHSLQEAKQLVIYLEETEIQKYKDNLLKLETELTQSKSNYDSSNQHLNEEIQSLKVILEDTQKKLETSENENILNVEKLKMQEETVSKLPQNNIQNSDTNPNDDITKMNVRLDKIKEKILKNDVLHDLFTKQKHEIQNTVDAGNFANIQDLEILFDIIASEKLSHENVHAENLQGNDFTSPDIIDKHQHYLNLIQRICISLEVFYNESSIDKTVEDVIEKISNIRSSCENYIKQNNDLIEIIIERENFLTENNSNFNAIKSLQEDISNLQKQLEILSNSNESTLSDKKRLELEISNLISVNQSLTQNVAELKSALAEQKEQHQFKIKDFESQIVEYRELEEMLQAKTKQIETLNNKNQQLIEEKNLIIQKADSDASEMIKNECLKLQEEIENQTQMYMNKTKESDELKLDVLRMEHENNQLKNQIDQMKHLEEFSEKLLKAEHELDIRNNKITELNSVIEDLQAKINNSQKEKTFMDVMVKENEKLKQNVDQLLIQQQHLNASIQEKDVILKQKEVIGKEVEAKTSRELERLRHHLMTIEENHTQEIVEFQHRQSELEKELNQAKDVLSRKSIILQDSNKQFQNHVEDLQEQLHLLTSQRDEQALHISKLQDKVQEDANAMFNLQNALEQLQQEKDEQYEYLSTSAKRRQDELEKKIFEMNEEQMKMQLAMSEASLAVQGISKIRMELNQKDNELTLAKEKMHDLSMSLQEYHDKWNTMVQSSEEKLDKSLLRNLLSQYFQASDDKRADIVQVIGNLIGFSHEEIARIGNGSAPSKVSGWMSNVWGFAATTPKKAPVVPKTPITKVHTQEQATNQSFSELFVKFLENETEKRTNMQPASLMLPQTPPDILSSHKSKAADPVSNVRIPAPGQEIAKVHTHHAQSTLKTLLS